MPHGSYCAEQVRRFDADRYATALFAPAPARHDLLTLYAFNLEVARTREAVSEPMLGYIRLQWWRDAVAECYDGRPRDHLVVQELASTIARNALSRPLFDRLIDAREADLDDTPPATLDALVDYASESSGTLACLALETVAARDADSLRAGERAGTAWALAGLLRALPYLNAVGRAVLPADLVRKHGLSADFARDAKASAALRGIAREIATTARDIVEETRQMAGRVAPEAVPVMLLATLADLYLRRLARSDFDPLDARNAAPLPFRALRLALRAARGRY